MTKLNDFGKKLKKDRREKIKKLVRQEFYNNINHLGGDKHFMKIMEEHQEDETYIDEGKIILSSYMLAGDYKPEKFDEWNISASDTIYRNLLSEYLKNIAKEMGIPFKSEDKSYYTSYFFYLN